MAEPDAAPVTWWDPASLDLEIEQLAPLRHQRLLEIDSGGVTAAESTRNYETWKTERRTLLARGSEPSVQVQTVTALVRSSEGSELGTEPSVDVHVVDRDDADRPGGRRFGTFVHALLALIDLESTTDALKKTAAVQGRMLGATEEEIDAAVATVSRALAHPILRTAAASARTGRLRREVPVLLRRDDGSLVEGVVDLAFQHEAPDFAGWTVVDFKTDREFEGSSEGYLDQVRWYSMAVREATNLPTRGVLLVI